MERGHRRQEQGLCCRKPVAVAGAGQCCRALGWEEVVPGRWEAREAVVESPLRRTIVPGRRAQVVQAR